MDSHDSLYAIRERATSTYLSDTPGQCTHRSWGFSSRTFNVFHQFNTGGMSLTL